MNISQEDIMSKGCDICENCDFATEQENSDFLKCLIDNQEKGLFNYCDKFKRKSGNHITV